MGTEYNKPAVLPAWSELNTTPSDMIQPSNGEIQAGWPLSTTPPSRQRWNWLLNFAMNAVNYFLQRGVPDYDAAETYRIGSCVIGDDGNTYRSLIHPNIGNTPSTSPSDWQRWGLTAADIQAGALAVVLASGNAAPVIDLSLGTKFFIKLTLDVSPTIVNASDNQSVEILVLQDGTGGHAFNWPAGLPGSPVSPAANDLSRQTFFVLPTSHTIKITSPMNVG